MKGHIVDVISKEIYDGEIVIENEKIKEIVRCKVEDNAPFILPGFIDSHIHIESSMLVPHNFAQEAVKHGTIGVVTDPHEIANVLGTKGVEYMIQDSKNVPFYFCFGAPSCVPSTDFETAGAKIDSKDIENLLQNPDIHYLSEMMFYYGVVIEDPEVMAKLAAAKRAGKPIDGHAPQLSGNGLKKYIAEGISTDHECTSYQEALEKFNLGMCIQIREGSAAKNYEALAPLLKMESDHLMFCSDDRHAEDLVQGHIDKIVKRALKDGYPMWNVLRAACLNPKIHYGLQSGLLRIGDNADFILVDNLQDINILDTYIKGESQLTNSKKEVPVQTINNFHAQKVTLNDLTVQNQNNKLTVIGVVDGALITNRIETEAKVENGNVAIDIENDILKIVTLNRYTPSKPAVGFIKGFGLKRGAIGATVAHDCHNILAVGTSDEAIMAVINRLIELQGGTIVYDGSQFTELPLPVAGLMSTEKAHTVAERSVALLKAAKGLGCQLAAPFMTLSFMALPVIPSLKLTDKGLFDVDKFQFVE